MRDFRALIREIKQLISQNTKIKILDKDVADALGLSQANFATIKRRNSTPYENILHFCKKENICSNELFFGV